MLTTLLQYGFRTRWDSQNTMMHSTPIPNDISLKNAQIIQLTNMFPKNCNIHIGAYFKSRDCEQRFINCNEYNNEIAYFPIEIFEVYQSLLIDNVIGKIQPNIMKMLCDPNCNLRLLIWFPTEGYHMDNMKTAEMITHSLNVTGICKEKIYFIYGDLNCNKNIHKDIIPNINWYGMSYFENATVDSYNDTPDLLGKITEEDFLENFNKPKSKYFLYKNRVCRPYRFLAYAMTYDRDLLKYSHHSFMDLFNQVEQGGFNQLGECKDIFPGYLDDLYKKLRKTDFLQSIPKILDAGKEEVELTQWSTTKFYQQDSHFSFVSETVVESGLMFLSEKTFKCILNYHPFILFGNPNTLDYLKSVGYKTFDFVFDESYDNEHHIEKRLEMILDVIEYTCSGAVDHLLYSDQMRDTLIHNHNHLLKRQFEEYKKLYRYLTT